MKGQSRERMRSEHRRQEMAGSGSSPPSPPFSCTPDRGSETNRGGGGGDLAWVYTWVLTCPISTKEKAAAYTDLLDVT